MNEPRLDSAALDPRVLAYFAGRGITDVELVRATGARWENGCIVLPWLDQDGNEIYVSRLEP